MFLTSIDIYSMEVQAFDGQMAGASHRDIAAVLYGGDMVKVDWRGRSDYLRCRVQRSLRLGHMLAHGGYRRLLR